MSPQRVAFAALLLALAPVAGSAPGHAVRALAPLEVVADRLDEPGGIAVDSGGTAFVADRGRGTVLALKLDGSRTTMASRLARPAGVAVDTEGRVLVSEEGAGRVLRLEAAGPRVLASGLRRPRALAIGDDGSIYVVAGARRDGDGESDDDDGPADTILVITPGGQTSIFADALAEVSGIVVDASAVYVAMRAAKGYVGVRRFPIRPDGGADPASWVGRRDVVRRAAGLARDRLGALWLSGAEADLRGARARDVVVKLGEGDTAAVFAQGLDEPRGLAFGPEGHLYLTDARAGRLLRFRPPPAPELGELPEVVPGTALAVQGSASPGSRVDLFVNDAETPTSTIARADGAFDAVVVLAADTESRLEAFATAALGHGLSSAPTVVSVRHDGDEPELAFVRPLAGAFVRQRIAVEVRASDGGSGVAQLALDAAARPLELSIVPPLPATAVAGAATWDTKTAADGAVTLAARAVDRAGRARDVTRVVLVDNTPPTVEILEAPDGETADTTVGVRFTGTDNLTPSPQLEFAWRLDGGDFSAFSAATSLTLGPLTAGPHRFEVTARDLAGNEASAPAARTFIVTPAPSITAVIPAGGKVGVPVTIVGERLAPGALTVAFNGVPATVRRASATSVVTSVPPGATTGPISLVTDRGTAAHGFTVEHAQDVVLRVLPAALRTVVGLPVSAAITLESVGLQAFTSLAALRVSQSPAGVATTLDVATLTGGQSATLTLVPAPGVGASGTVTVEATATIDGGAVRRTATLALDIMAGDRTALAGRLLLVDGAPIAGARLALAGAAQETDAGGNFLFVDPPAGRQTLGLDVNAARAGLPIYAIDVELVAGTAMRLPVLHITPPPAPEQFVAIDNALRDQVVTDARFPGFSLTLPAGVTIVGWDGTLKNRIAIGQLTADALPVPPPEFAARSFYQIFFGTPMGGLPSAPLPITLPNDQDLEPGESVEIWYYDAAPIPGAPAGWRLAGNATVSADGTRAVSDPGVGIARFCGVCGIACIKRKVDGQPNLDLKGLRAGDPVDVATGLLVLEKTDLALPGRIPAYVHRVHNALDAFGRVAGFELSTGPGWTLSVDVALLDDGPLSRRLIMPGNARLAFAGTGDGTFTNATTPDLAGAVLHAEAGGAHRLVFKDGGSWRFRGDWRARGRLGTLTGLGLLVEQRDRHGNVLTIDRDAFGAVASVAEPAGRTLTFTTTLLDAADPMSARLTEVLDPLGRAVRYDYDALRRLHRVIDAAGGAVRYDYDGPTARITAITDPRGITYLRNEFDPQGRVVRQIQADGGVWSFQYEGPPGRHLRAVVTDPGGGATTHLLAAGRPTATIDALGQATRLERDAVGRVTAVVDALGRRVTLGYDGRGNVTTLTDPLGHVRTLSYEAADRPRALEEPLGVSSRLEYDGAGRLAAAVDAAGARVTFEVDALGQPVAVTDAAGQTRRFEYARTGDLIAMVDPLGRRTTFDYDAASRLIRRRDPLGAVVTFAYDALDRVVQAADASGVVRYDYDANGNLVAITDPLGRIVRYDYDVMDRRVAKTDALGMTERYEYDPLGNVTRVVDRKGQASVYVYDRLGRRVGSRHADGGVTDLTYDAGGRLVRAATDGEAVLLEYDAADRLVTETTSLGTTRHAWDALGRRTTTARPDGSLIAYAYGAGSRLIRLAQGPRVVDLEYDGAGRRRRVRLPGLVDAEYAYDGASRLIGLTYRRGQSVLGTLSYAYDDLDRRIAVAGSLASVLLPDAIDSADYDAANRQRRLGDRLLHYDANGNLTLATDSSGTRAFAWDARDRLTALTGPAGTTLMAYDALGRRTARKTAGGLTAFVYDGTDVVEDLAVDRAESYLRGPRPDELLATGDTAVLTDGLGSLLGLVDGDGAVRDVVAYEPFGRPVASASSTTRYGFTGREREGGDLYYYRARYYDAGLGRFISEDPLGLVAGINPYVYALNDPVNLVDPTGLRTYVMHGIWPDRTAFEDFAVALREADPGTRTLPWSGALFGGVVPSTRGVADDLMPQILADLAVTPLAPGEKLNLIGFSGGGLVAGTLAEMLRARGVKVATVVSMGTPAQTPLTTTVPAQTRLLNFIGVADPLVSFRLHPRGTNYLILATHSARSYTENAALLALVKREIAR